MIKPGELLFSDKESRKSSKLSIFKIREKNNDIRKNHQSDNINFRKRRNLEETPIFSHRI